ncbi:MAG TPA: PDZ domain-containing protein, partial [Armatimonadota bacterium]|nr:PDZ domain-containing protein [Armatimonadota bacterium]
ELIGINFMIFSPSSEPGSVGIGFAIPINAFTKQVIEALVSGKAFERGQLGVRIADLDATLREEYGVKAGGVFVHEVSPGSAAEKAGILAEDIIVAVNGTTISDSNQFVRLIEATKPGATVTVTVMRNKKTQDVMVTMGAADAPRTNSYAAKLGLTVTGITPEMAAQLRLPVTRGVVITNVAAGSVAEEADLRRGDIILRIGTAFQGVEVTTPEEFWAAVDTAMNARGSLGVVMQVRRGARVFIRTLAKPAE